MKNKKSKDTFIELLDGMKISLKEMIIQDMKLYLSHEVYNNLYKNINNYSEDYLVNLMHLLKKLDYTSDLEDSDLPF